MTAAIATKARSWCAAGPVTVAGQDGEAECTIGLSGRVRQAGGGSGVGDVDFGGERGF
jgi:hypothetical protein